MQTIHQRGKKNIRHAPLLGESRRRHKGGLGFRFMQTVYSRVCMDSGRRSLTDFYFHPVQFTKTGII
ncbi:hypothetical protein EM6_1336 [Asticcacaulis excentricus]|uniref:Uncharacterized protein n=1 Tax=Asticcacaulis excentricus TaxID=78587 RepID=A0A3G9G4T9_9CAUL|nr:hypothetical protein EM6_1336 [Asticcacaulis excentricus]